MSTPVHLRRARRRRWRRALRGLLGWLGGAAPGLLTALLAVRWP